MYFEGEKRPLAISLPGASVCPFICSLPGWLADLRSNLRKRSKERRRNEGAPWKNSSFIINLRLQLNCFPQAWRLQWKHGIGPVKLKNSEKETVVVERSVKSGREVLNANRGWGFFESLHFLMTHSGLRISSPHSLLPVNSCHSIRYITWRECIGIICWSTFVL